MLETVRQYALEKLAESGEGDDVRARHRDHYLDVARVLDDPGAASDQQQIGRVESEIDNLRAAFAWSLDRGDPETALRLATALAPLWVIRGRIQEAIVGWFDAALAESDRRPGAASPAVVSRAFADKAVLHTWAVGSCGDEWAEHAVEMARETGDQALVARALTARAVMAASRGEAKQEHFDEAIGSARSLGDKWTLGQVLAWQASFEYLAGEPIAARTAAEEGHRVATEVGDRFTLRLCTVWLGWAQVVVGDLAGSVTRLRDLEIDAAAAQDALPWALANTYLGLALAYRGDTESAQLALNKPMQVITDLGDLWLGNANGMHAVAHLAAGETSDVVRTSAEAWERLYVNQFHQKSYVYLRAEGALLGNDIAQARRWADGAVSVASCWHRVLALTTRSRVAIAQGDTEQAERDAYDGLSLAAALGALLGVPDLFELVATLAIDAGRFPEAARLFGAADALRQRMGSVRFQVYESSHAEAIDQLRAGFGDNEFDDAYAEGAAMATEEAIAYAQRGRGQRKRPSSGWASLTPTERAVVDLVSEGLGNKAVAGRLFISLRTVESHLTHVYTKLGLTSRVQLAQEAARHA